MVGSRRGLVLDDAAGGLHGEQAVDRKVDCQAAIRALQEAIADEEKRGKGGFTYDMG